MRDALISIRTEFTHQILAGRKTLELRTRKPSFEPGTTLWIYESAKGKRVVGVCDVESVIAETPQAMWNRYSSLLAITWDTFKNYVDGREVVYGVQLGSITPLTHPISLHRLREVESQFQPPQFFRWIEHTSPIHRLLSTTSVGAPLSA